MLFLNPIGFLYEQLCNYTKTIIHLRLDEYVRDKYLEGGIYVHLYSKYLSKEGYIKRDIMCI